ncbi:MAG: ribulokinase, partial [Armatimonadota bacterium]
MPKYAIGVDYGTSSCRAVIVDLTGGSEVATAVYAFNGGEDGVITDDNDPNLARQLPSEYRQGLITTVKQVLAESGIRPEEVVGIGTDATGSTPLPLDQDGHPLAENFPDDPSAMAWLWKDHTAHAEAAEITALAQKRGEPFLSKCGGAYSSEWLWSKILHCTRTSPDVQNAAATWIECSDYIPALITGTLGDPTRTI